MTQPSTARGGLAAALLGLLAAPVAAQQSFTAGVTISDSDPAAADLFVEDYTVLDGQVCIGNGCASGVLPDANTGLLLKSSSTIIDFEDTSGNPGYAARDWQLRVNDPGSSGIDRFSVKDRTADTIPFTIEGGAPDNALWIDGFTGYVGLGTTIPLDDLHIVNGYYPGIRLEAQGLGGQAPQSWLIKNLGRFQILDATHSNDAPFSIDPSTDDDLLRLFGSHVAIGGYFAADSSLHIQRDDGSASLHVEELSATVSPRTLLHLENSGRPEIVMGNTDTGGEWSFGAGTNFILKQGAVGSASNAKTKLFEIDATGNATLTGSLTTGGPSCASGCDAVLADGYALPSIAEHAAAMKRLGHLPNVGPTLPGAPLDLSERYGTLLNELEHAHLYIAQQQAELTAQRGELAALKTVVQALVADRN